MISRRCLINNTEAFDIYFHEFVYGGLTVREMENMFTVSLDEAKLFIDRSVSENKFKYLISFLDSKNILIFDSKNNFERFLDLLLYINCKNYDSYVPYLIILKLLYIENRKQVLEKYSYTEQDYKCLVVQKLSGNYPCYPNNMTKGIILGIIKNEFPQEIIFTKEEILNIAKKALFNLISKEPTVSQKHIDLLYSCISDIDQTTKITLDPEACLKIKDLIKENPAGYFEKFVRLGWWSLNSDFNSVACEPFWRQIIGNETEMSTFIETNQNKIPKVRLINNFWKLYKNNGYKPIEFQNQGNVQDKIDNNLEAEVSDLNTTY